MFYLFHGLADRYPALQTLLQPEVRALLAAVCAFCIALIAGPPLIRALKTHQFVDQVKKGDSRELDRKGSQTVQPGEHSGALPQASIRRGCWVDRLQK